MIDHVSIAVRDLASADGSMTALLAPLGMTKLREWPDAAIGFGKKYPEFWINRRAAMDRGRRRQRRAYLPARARYGGCRRLPCRRAEGRRHVRRRAGTAAEYHDGYYAAFIRDPDGNRIEAVTFVSGLRIRT